MLRWEVAFCRSAATPLPRPLREIRGLWGRQPVPPLVTLTARLKPPIARSAAILAPTGSCHQLAARGVSGRTKNSLRRNSQEPGSNGFDFTAKMSEGVDKGKRRRKAKKAVMWTAIALSGVRVAMGRAPRHS